MPPRQPARQAAVPRRGRRVGQADLREQRRIAVQRAGRDDQEPACVPDRATDEARVGNGFRGIKVAAVVEGAERPKAPDRAKVLDQGVVDRNPGGIVQRRGAQREFYRSVGCI